jgi:hypothetical protein
MNAKWEGRASPLARLKFNSETTRYNSAKLGFRLLHYMLKAEFNFGSYRSNVINSYFKWNSIKFYKFCKEQRIVGIKKLVGPYVTQNSDLTEIHSFYLKAFNCILVHGFSNRGSCWILENNLEYGCIQAQFGKSVSQKDFNKIFREIFVTSL